MVDEFLDGYEFEMPEELQSWIEYQKEKQAQAHVKGFGYYVCINGRIKQATMMEWAAWFNDISQRQIDFTKVGDVDVSTVCLGLDHNFNFDEFLEHKPILFESMVFGGELDQFQWRYSSYGEAKQGHREIIAAVREDRSPDMSIGEEGFWNLFRRMFEDKEDEEE